VIVAMRTKEQARRVSELTGGKVIVKDTKPTAQVSLPGDFEQYREAVESVSVLFSLYDNAGNPIPSGWTLTGATFEVEWPKNQLVNSHFGARRFAYNWALATVKADMDAKKNDASYNSTAWTLAALRKRWNQEKSTVAPWWATNSKECYASGIADLVQALENWSESKGGKRKGKRVGFPKFASKHKDHGRVRFTTGTMRFEDDRRTIVLPTIGALRSKENTRRVQRHLAKGNARLLNCTLSERWGRLFVSCQLAVRDKIVSPTNKAPAKPTVYAGVDLGLRSFATVTDSNGDLIIFSNPTPLRKSMAESRRTERQLSRRIPGSRGYEQARTKLNRLYRKTTYMRRENVHQVTRQLVNTYGEIKIEDLNIAATKQSMGRRAFRRSVSDAGLGVFRPTLTYKAQRANVKVVVVDRYFPSSQLHHGCTGRLVGAKLAKRLTCDTCHVEVDRDENASLNIRDWSNTNCGLVESTALFVPGSSFDGTGDGSDDGLTHHLERASKSSSHTGLARRGKNDSWMNEPTSETRTL
jgi:putative transposase